VGARAESAAVGARAKSAAVGARAEPAAAGARAEPAAVGARAEAAAAGAAELRQRVARAASAACACALLFSALYLYGDPAQLRDSGELIAWAVGWLLPGAR